MKRRTDRIVPSSCWEQLRTGKVWQRLSLALFVAVMTMTAQTAWAGDGDIIYVSPDGTDENDGSEDAPLKTIAKAVQNATGGETIYILDGEYTEGEISIGSKQLTFTGQGQDRVIIKSVKNNLFFTNTSGYSSIVIRNLTFKDISMTGTSAPIRIGGDGAVTIENCTFDNCASRYGAMCIYTSGSATIDNCTFLNTKSSTGSYSSAIDFYGSSTTEWTITNTVIDGSSISDESTASYIFGAIYDERTGGTVTLDNVTIRNCNLEKASGLIATKGDMVIKNSQLVNNYVYRDNSVAGFIFVSGAATVTIESSLIQGNSDPKYFLSSNSASASFDLNYNNIQGNTFNEAFTNPDNGSYTLDANYWGSNELPDGITASTWIIDDDGESKLNTGDPLEKVVPVIPYIDADGNAANCMVFTMIDGSETTLGTEGKTTWYVVKNSNTDANVNNGVDAKYTGTLTLNGNVNLILCDGAEMSVTCDDDDGIVNNGSLTIYGQSTGDGELTVISTSGSGISGGTVTLAGGTVTASSYSNCSVIIADGFTYSDGDGHTYSSGTLDDGQITDIAGKTLTGEPGAVLTNVVTPSNFYSFFDEYGGLLDDVNVPFDELIFKGDFTDTDLVSYITIDRPITITGDHNEDTGEHYAVLNDMSFIIAGSEVTLDNLTLVANSDLGNLIDIAGENVVISNNNITYVVSDPANAINVYSGANGVQILNNTINFTSTVDHYTLDDVTNAICVNSGASVSNDDADPITGLVIDGNEITAVIPALSIIYNEIEYYDVIGLSTVNGVRINGAEDFEFTNNILDVTTNRLDDYGTLQAMYVASSSGIINENDISMIDTFTPDGEVIYLYAVNLVNDNDLDISNNNFNISTDGGTEAFGTACAIESIASEFNVVDNNINIVSKGPNYGIYFPSMMGDPCDAEIRGNFIKVTGLATADNQWSFVSGIEIQTGAVVISGNTIYTYNIGEYAEGNYIYGISYAQTIYGDSPEVEITDNTIITEGDYAISFLKVDDAVITGNNLCAHELYGDDAVSAVGDNNVIEDNLFGYVIMPKTDEITFNIPTNVSSFKVYDDGGQNGIYSPGCAGTLTLTAPDGYRLQLSGNIKTEKDNDYLTVYDGSSNQANVLINKVSSSVSGTETDIPTVISTGNVMTLYFCSDNSDSGNSEFDGLDLTVTLIYNLNETDGITSDIATQIAGKPAQFTRTGITANAYSTVCLPFDFTTPTGCTIYGFQGIHYNEDALDGQGAWVADIAETTEMKAHTPYIFKSTGTEATFSGTASNADDYSSALGTNAVSATVGSDKAWTFKGTYSAIDWSGADPTEPTYGFSTYVPEATIAAGTFVRFVKGASLAPFRARLIYSGTDTNLSASTRGAADELPQYIIVRIVNAGGTPTAIGTLDTRTGEISTDSWFDLNGRRLSGKPAKKGMYIHNGKVVMK